jgi:5-methylcytosine-specific restriction enzyme A
MSPSRPAKLCCRCGAVHSGRCPGAAKHGWETGRGKTAARGYGGDWQALRSAFLAQHPLCADCESHGLVRPARHVDHVVPFQGIDDPLRLDRSNLRALCERCHMVKTGRDGGAAR